MTEIPIYEILDIKQRENSIVIIFQSRYDPKIFNQHFVETNGKYIPYSFTFEVYDTHIVYPELPADYFRTTETITLQDCLYKNYTPIELMLTRDNVFRVTDGQHRILRILWLCLNNQISLDNIKINCVIKEYT